MCSNICKADLCGGGRSAAADGRVRAADQARTGAAGSNQGVIMMPEFENTSYIDADRLAILENRAAELERRLLLVMRPEGDAYPNLAVPNAVPNKTKVNIFRMISTSLLMYTISGVGSRSVSNHF